MIKLRPDNLRRARGEFPKEVHLGLAKETIELMDRHIPMRNVEGRRGVAGPFADLGIRVLCALLSGDLPEMDDVADTLTRAVGSDQEGLDALRELASNALLLSNALDRQGHKMRWALSEIE